MTISTVQLAESGYLVDGTLNVPNDTGNRHYQEVKEWLLTNTPDPIPVIVLITEQQAAEDLQTAGVSNNSVTAALFLDSQGTPEPLNQINSSINIVVNTSGLSLSVVSNLI